MENISFEEIKLLFKETDARFKESNAEFLEYRKETEKIFREMGKKIANQGKQIGGIGNKFGHLVEGLAYTSVEKILRDIYGIDHITARLKVYDKTNIEIAEVDVFGYCNSTINNAVLVEVKSNLKPEEVEEFVAVLEKFNTLFPEHKGKNVYGIIATPIIFDDSLKKRIKSLGIGTATISNETFTMAKADRPSKNWKV